MTAIWICLALVLGFLCATVIAWDWAQMNEAKEAERESEAK